MLWNLRNNLANGHLLLGRFGLVANIVILVWSLTALVFYSLSYYLPFAASKMNYVTCMLVGFVQYAGIYWVIYGRSNLLLPHPMLVIWSQTRCYCRLFSHVIYTYGRTFHLVPPISQFQCFWSLLLTQGLQASGCLRWGQPWRS